MANVTDIDVEVVRHGEDAMLVTDGDTEGWVPYSLIDEESDVTRKSDEGYTGTLVIPEWKAEKLGIV